MKKKLIYLGMLVILLALGMVFTACGDMAELKITNDTSRTYTIKVIIDNEEVYSGGIAAGGNRSHSRNTGFPYRVYVSSSSYVNTFFSPYFYGDVSPGDVEDIKISEILHLNP